MNQELSGTLYQQVQTVLENKIRNGEWEKNYRLPSEQELAKQFNVSTITVKRAILELVNKGILYRRRGKGTYVTEVENDKNLYNMIVFGERTKHQEYPHTLLSSVLERAGNSIASKFNKSPETLVHKFSRLKIEKEKVVGIEYSHILYNLCPKFNVELTRHNLIFNVLKDEYGVKLSRAKVYFSSVLPNEKEAEILEISMDSPLFIIERFTYTEKEEMIEYSKFIVKQENVDYFLEFSIT